MFIVVALAFIPAVLAGGYLSGLLHALNASGLDQLVHAALSLNGTTAGRQLLIELSQGNQTIFAPTDSALSSINPATINNQTTLANLISYHIVSGNYVNETQTYPNVTIGRTLLNDPTLVTLEGNQSQVLIWSKCDTNRSLFVINQGSNVTVVNAISYNTTAILAIDSVLTPPPDVSTILNNASYDLTDFAAILNSTTLPNGPSLLDELRSAHGYTLFAPDNAGVQAAQNSLSGLSNNATALLNVLSNHYINGTTVYSTEITPKTTLVSAGGQVYVFSANSTGYYVSVGGSNQVEITETNVLSSNGVMHIVNGVMLDASSNAAAASSAFASATSAAAHATQSGGGTTPSPGRAVSVKGGANNWKLGALTGMVIGFGFL
ncbi:FAS1 domain-containing protein [Butyriboletus roseoflavus]|nr:FAS1 domain-containing protein [Butyriboletus roseoflavus]